MEQDENQESKQNDPAGHQIRPVMVYKCATLLETLSHTKADNYLDALNLNFNRQFKVICRKPSKQAYKTTFSYSSFRAC